MASAADVPTATDEAQATAGFRPIVVPAGVVAVVAIGTAAAALIKFDLSGRAFVAAFFCVVLVILAAIDLEKRIIPNRIVVPAAIVVLVGNIVAEPDNALEWTIAAFATSLVALAIALATRGGIGMGDVKLAFLIGAGLGYDVLDAIIVTVLATFLVAVGILARRGLDARKDQIPFGPFLVLGALVALFLS